MRVSTITSLEIAGYNGRSLANRFFRQVARPTGSRWCCRAWVTPPPRCLTSAAPMRAAYYSGPEKPLRFLRRLQPLLREFASDVLHDGAHRLEVFGL